MWRTHRSVVVVAGAILLCAIACYADPDTPPTDPPEPKLIAMPADLVPTTPLDSFRVQMFGGTLRDMHEPILDGTRAPAGMTVIRMIWVRSFDPPSAVRMVETPGHCKVVVAITGVPWQRYSPRGSDSVWRVDAPWPYTGLRPIVRRDSSEVPLERCAAIHSAAIAARLWSGPVVGKEIGLDGDDVAFEIVDTAGHRFATRWTPRPGSSPEFRDVAERFIFIGRIDARMGSLEGHWSPWADR